LAISPGAHAQRLSAIARHRLNVVAAPASIIHGYGDDSCRTVRPGGRTWWPIQLADPAENIHAVRGPVLWRTDPIGTLTNVRTGVIVNG
jgi:hypothetical protein